MKLLLFSDLLHSCLIQTRMIPAIRTGFFCLCSLSLLILQSCATGYFYRAPNPTVSSVGIMNINSFEGAHTLGTDKAEIGAMLSTPLEIVGRASRLNDAVEPPLHAVSARANGFVVPSFAMKYGINSSLDVGMNMTTIFLITGISTKFYAKWNILDTTSTLAIALMPSVGYSLNFTNIADASGEASGGAALGEIALPISYAVPSGNFSLNLTPRLTYLNFQMGYTIESTIYTMVGSGGVLGMPRTVAREGTLQSSMLLPGASLGMKFFRMVSAELTLLQSGNTFIPLFGLSFQASFTQLFSSPYSVR